MRKIHICGLVLFLLLLVPQAFAQQEDQAAMPKTMYVNAFDGLRMRSAPGLEAERIGVLPDLAEVLAVQEQEATVTIDRIKGKWTFVRHGGTEGWVFGGYLSEEPADHFVINWSFMASDVAFIKGYTGNSTEITIPPQIQDAPVEIIGDSVFENRGITSIAIPDSVTHISDGAFRNNKLVRVVTPANIEVIGENAFAENPITSITIGADVELQGSNTKGESSGILGEDISFDEAYNNGGKLAGTYTRPDAESTEWTREE